MESTKYHILLLGATGVCGLLFIQAALAEGHALTLYTRSPSKLPDDIISNPNITVIEGELSDDVALKKAAACGANVFISFAGPTLGKRDGMPITNALHSLFPLLLEARTYMRILTLSTPSYSAPEDIFSLKWYLIINGYIRIFGGDAYNEIRGIASETVALEEKARWTVFRVPKLSGTELCEIELGHGDVDVNACFVGDAKGRDGLSLDRGRLVRWVLGELAEEKWVGCCPLISNA